MTDDDKKTHSGKAQAGRRRFVKGAVGAAPVIMTLASRPVWGARNCTYSGQLSGNLSDQDEQPCGGEGCSPGYWKTHPDRWSPAFPPEAYFNDVFGTTFNPSRTLIDVINDECSMVMIEDVIASCAGGGTNTLKNYQKAVLQLAFHAIAGLQNAATAVSYDLTVDEVIMNFQDAYNGGSCDKDQVTGVKDVLDVLNNQGSPFCAGSSASPCKGNSGK